MGSLMEYIEIEMAVRGRKWAITKIVKRYQKRLMGWFRYRGMNDADAKDLTQEVMLELFTALPKFRSRTRKSLNALVFKIGKARFARLIKNKKRQIRIKELRRYWALEKIDSGSDLTEQDIEELKEQFEALLLRLPLKEEQVIRLKYQQQLSDKDSCETLNISSFIFNKRLENALRQLERWLEE